MKHGGIIVTTRCNMECAHCGRSCTYEGKDISLENFYKATNYLKNMNVTHATITGGEPTLHPNFFVFIAILIDAGIIVDIATNGKERDVVLKLCNLALEMPDNLVIALSVDKYHEPIDADILELFKANFKLYNLELIKGGKCQSGGKEFCNFKCEECARPSDIITIDINGLVRKCFHPDGKPIFDIGYML